MLLQREFPVALVVRGSPGENAGEDCHALLQGIFPTLQRKPYLFHLPWWLRQYGPRPAPSLMEAGAATRTGGDLGGQQASLAWGRQALGTFWAGGGSERGRKAK